MSTDLTTPMNNTPTAEVLVVGMRQPVKDAMHAACLELAEQDYLGRFEIAVKSRVQQGIKDDNDLRLTDELLVNVVRGGDAVDALCKPAIAAAHALHKELTTEAKLWIAQDTKTRTWEGRWGVLREQLSRLILKYRRDKEDLARRQQEELDRAAEAERQRLAAESRAALRAGDVAAAKAVMEEAQSLVTPIVMTATPTLDHSSSRKPWAVEITDPEAVVKAIAAGTIPMSAIKEFDINFLKREAAKRGGLQWPGIVAKQVDALSVKR